MDFNENLQLFLKLLWDQTDLCPRPGEFPAEVRVGQSGGAQRCDFCESFVKGFWTGRNGLEQGMARKLRDAERTKSNQYSTHLPDSTIQIGNYRMVQFYFSLCWCVIRQVQAQDEVAALLGREIRWTLAIVFGAVFFNIIIFKQIISICITILSHLIHLNSYIKSL